jgi:squalene-hopene/tetraprenyl-beta-curcumene cyclase
MKRSRFVRMTETALQTGTSPQLALERAREHLLSLQDPRGFWRGELQTNVTMDAEDILLREFLGVRRAPETQRSAAWIRSQQRPDGTWSNFHEGPGDISTTVEAYWALRVAGDAPSEPHMRAAARFVRDQGGLERARVFTHLWLALFGLWSWDRVPALPTEIVLLPRWVPLNIYDFACWARQTIVALSVVKSHRPVHPLSFDLRELHAPTAGAASPDAAPEAAPLSRARVLRALDALLRRFERHPPALLRKVALQPAPRAGSCAARRPTAHGAGSSRRGCTR